MLQDKLNNHSNKDSKTGINKDNKSTQNSGRYIAWTQNVDVLVHSTNLGRKNEEYDVKY